MSARASRTTAAISAGLIGTLLIANPTAAQDNTPRGRTPVAIVKGQYPASYFPNTELLGSDEMRITALGTGMPNQTIVSTIGTCTAWPSPVRSR